LTPTSESGSSGGLGRCWSLKPLTGAGDGLLVQHRLLICDRDTKWSAPVRVRLAEARDPYGADAAPGTKRKRLRRTLRALHQTGVSERVIPFGDRHRRRMIAEFVAQYQRERNHQGLGNELIEAFPQARKSRLHSATPAARRLLSYYSRAA